MENAGSSGKAAGASRNFGSSGKSSVAKKEERKWEAGKWERVGETTSSSSGVCLLPRPKTRPLSTAALSVEEKRRVGMKFSRPNRAVAE